MVFTDRKETAERFIRYASICTQSEENVPDTPSTAIQRDLAILLYRELKEMGASDVVYDEEKCYVYAELPANLPADEETAAALSRRSDTAGKRRTCLAPVIGFAAHMDTSNAVSASEIHPRLIESYDGGVITLNEQEGICLSPEEFPDLKDQTGAMLVVTDGTSVLGGDDKAGVTQIMELMRFYLAHPEYPHGTVRIMFTPDEEVGNGTLNADLKQFAADYAYTVDGSTVGELEYENFNAAGARLILHGLSTHPGDAKDKMRNALQMAMDLHALLPEAERPEHTEGYEGFFHLISLEGTCDEARMEYIIRDHDRGRFEQRKELMREAAHTIEARCGEGTVDLILEDSYYNMAEKILPHPELIDIASKAIRDAGLTVRTQPIRGGTDGCRLSFSGIPCPNLGTGAYHYHSRYEYVSVDEMVRGVEVLVRIVGTFAGYRLNDETAGE
ncbi:MAG: peptidase T [Lachnospiraceae bacterium]|nr:peptidase T [Lachnospiraceae bacterium]